jgi:uncharacterized protein HemX
LSHKAITSLADDEAKVSRMSRFRQEGRPMFTKIPAAKLAEKALAATVICGTLALGTGGAAFAVSQTTVPGSTPAASGHVTCARAPKVLAKITKVEKFAGKRLPALEAKAQKLTAAGHRKLAGHLQKKIKNLQKADAKAGAMSKKIEARCPSGTNS